MKVERTEQNLLIIIIILLVPRAVGVLVLGRDSPISPVVMTARLQEPAMFSSGSVWSTLIDRELP